MEQAIWFAESDLNSRPYFLIDTVPRRIGVRPELPDRFESFVIRTVTVLSMHAPDGRAVFIMERVERIPRRKAEARTTA